ncbi:hypothetical protein D3C81_1591460 [compost metagenome]
MQKYRVSAGTPQRMACRKLVAPGTISGAMPNAGRNAGTTLRNRNISTLRPTPSHSAWRNNGPISRSRPAPCNCETEAVSEIRVPIGTSIGSHSNAVPMLTAAKVSVPWWPAMVLSTKAIRPVETWPSTNGNASRPVVRTSFMKRGVAGEVDIKNR